MKKMNPLGVVLIIFLLIAVVLFFSKKENSALKSPTQTTEEITSTEKDQILAQGNSQYKEFSQSEFEKALRENKIVYLEFYANWCPICRAQEPDLIEGFKQLKRNDVVGLRVNYKDDQTDEYEKALAEKYKIPYQHHKIVLQNNNVVINSAESWDSATLVEELSKL